MKETKQPTIAVGVDARHLDGSMHGAVRYTLETLSEMTTLSRFKFHLLSNRPISLPEHLVGSVITLVDSHFSRLPGAIWLALRAGQLAHRLDLDVFWGPLQALPITSLGMPQIVTIHDLAHVFHPQTLQRRNLLIQRLAFPRAIKSATSILAVSHTTANDIANIFGTSLKEIIEVIPEGRTHFGPPNSSPPVKGDYILCIGSVEPRKNLEALVDVFHNARKELPDLKLVIAGGGGWKNTSLYTKIKDLGLTDHIIATGRYSDNDLATYLTHARLFVFPSLYEGFGLPLLEAVGYCPALVSDIPIFKELGQHLSGIEYTDFSQTEEAAAALVRLVKRPEESPLSFIDTRADRLFSWEECTRRHADLFERLARIDRA